MSRYLFTETAEGELEEILTFVAAREGRDLSASSTHSRTWLFPLPLTELRVLQGARNRNRILRGQIEPSY
jgi:hypothetical protein